MAVAFRAGSQGAQGSTGGSTTTTFSYTSGSGSDRLLLLQTYGSSDASAATYAGAAMTNVGSGGSIRLWRKTAPATGANNFVVTIGTYSYTARGASDWTGVDQSTPLGTLTSATGSSSVSTTASITCPTDGAVFGGSRSNYTSAPGTTTANTGTLIGWVRHGSNGQVLASSYRMSTGTLAWNLPGNIGWGVHGIPINPAVSFTAKLPHVYSQAIQGSVI